MELVYLWISKYKNIENQGFNLNSKWQVEYNDQTKELKVEKRNPQPIANFFGENISNVTAIVGENGAGKSSLMDLLILFTTGSKVAVDLAIKTNKAILILIADNDVLNIYSTESININNSLTWESFDGYRPTQAIYYSPILEDNYRIFQGRPNRLYDNSISHRMYLHEHDIKPFKPSEIITQIEYITSISQSNNFNSYIHKLFKFPQYLLIKPSNIYDLFEKKIKNEININKNIEEKIILLISKINIKYIGQGLNHVKANVIIKSLYIIKSHIQEDELLNILSTFANFENQNDKIIDDFLDDLFQLNILIINNQIPSIKKYFELITTFLTESSVDDIFIIKPDKLYDSDLFYCINETIKNERHSDNIYSELSRCIYSIFEFKWLATDKEDDYLSFSAGEHLLLNTLAQLFNSQYDKFKFLYIDEGELGLHPNWQAQYLNIILAALEHYYYNMGHLTNKVHVILTTHSPFVLSDLPRENVVFLEKDKDGKCQVVKNPMERPQTFASNIHTLFAEGFFMREGTIGHFAKSKIEKVLTYLSKDPKEMNDKGKSEYEEITKIINLIGEPLIKNKLLRMIQDRNTLTVDERINNLQAQIDELKKQK